MLKIGSIDLANPVILAPMAGVTDPPFRKIVKKYHPGLVCGEMISATALHFNSRKTAELIRIDQAERPVSIQIFGSEPEIMAEAARVIASGGADIIDINMGCPVPKVVKNGEGAALLTNLPLAKAIIQSVVNSVKIPVTVKFRLGWDQGQVVAPELARIAEKHGVAAVILHARTRDQFYHGRADWSWIAKVKQGVTIPVIGNGDVDSPQAAQAMIEQTGCDGVMIGQAALGRPWLFRQVAAYLDDGSLAPTPVLAEQFLVINEHLELQTEYAGEFQGLKQMRKHLGWYLKGLPGSAKIRDRINTITSLPVMKEVLRQYEAAMGADFLNQEQL